jgi:uncharacterized membrane protein
VKPLALVLALAYPILAHVATTRHDADLMAVAVAVLGAALLGPALARGRVAAYVAAAALAAAIVLARRTDATAFLLYVPPVALNVLAGTVFARTLLPGRMPLIERMARLLRGEPLDPRIPPYARRVTYAWAVLLYSMAFADLVLACLAVPDGVFARLGVAPPIAVPQVAWSLFANVLSYVLIAALFVCEFAWRRVRFPTHEYHGIADFARRLASLGPSFWRQS